LQEAAVIRSRSPPLGPNSCHQDLSRTRSKLEKYSSWPLLSPVIYSSLWPSYHCRLSRSGKNYGEKVAWLDGSIFGEQYFRWRASKERRRVIIVADHVSSFCHRFYLPSLEPNAREEIESTILSSCSLGLNKRTRQKIHHHDPGSNLSSFNSPSPTLSPILRPYSKQELSVQYVLEAKVKHAAGYLTLFRGSYAHSRSSLKPW